MAKFDQIPKNQEELSDIIERNGFEKYKKELVSAYQYVKSQHPNIESPFSMSSDSNSKTKIKVLRAIATDGLLASLNESVSGFKFTAGDGSRTKKGLASAGITFEKILAADIQKYIEAGEDASISPNNLKFIKELWSHYELKKAKHVKVENVGEKRYRRPLSFSSDGITFSDGMDIGEKVSDITLDADGKKIFLSLKVKDFSYFNLGIKSFLTETEIKSGSIKEKRGLAILKMYGIDNEKFCEVFNMYQKSDAPKREVISSRAQPALIKFIKNAVGKGYHFVRRKSDGAIEHYEMDDSHLNSKAKADTVTVTYPYGSGKVIYVKFGNFEVHFRNNTSGLYPSVMIGYYKQK